MIRQILSILLALACISGVRAAPHFAVVGDHFELDGKPWIIRSGEMHYPRIPRDEWRARFKLARAMGLNTIQTYVFWNLHEPEPGRFDFSGNLDLAAFVRTAREEGLNVIVRPGPYVCAEWDFGGFPAWLLHTPGLRVRALDPRFLAASARYFKRVGEELKPLMSTRGGPILMAQVENEYGSFGDDHEYVAAIRQQMLDAGFDLPLFTADGPTLPMLDGGALPNVPAAINFSGNAADATDAFRKLAEARPGGPRMVGEFWDGWFDHWGEKHHTSHAADEAAAVDWFLTNGISFNLYMFAGGTNFGWMAGANFDTKVLYQPVTTSYDYDSPVDEAGRPTPKFFMLRQLMSKHLAPGEMLPPVPKPPTLIAIPQFELAATANLFDHLATLGASTNARTPQPMEKLGQSYGFVLYRKRLDKAVDATLDIDEVRDYAQVFVDGALVGTLDRRKGENKLKLATSAPATLDILVENMGRINFGERLVAERKGIAANAVVLGDKEITDWEIWSLPLREADMSKLNFTAKASGVPAFRRGEFELARVGGTFLDMRAWGKGHVWVNGHHLGRFWSIGPQQSLYVPGAWLRKGRNELVVLDVEPKGAAIRGVTHPIYETPRDLTQRQ